MGIIGELFGNKLNDEGSEDSDGQLHEPRVAVDLDAGVIRLSAPARTTEDETTD